MPNNVDLGSILRTGGQKQEAKGDPKDAEIADLKKQVTELMNAVQTLQNTPRQIPTTPQARPNNGQTFLSRRELADAYDDPNTLADVLNNAFAEFYQNIQGLVPNADKLTETLLETVNENLDNRIASRVVINNAISDFYRDNKELIPFKWQAGDIVNRLQAENPGWSIDQLLKETKEVMYKDYGHLIEAAKAKPNEAGKDATKDDEGKVNTQPEDGSTSGDDGGKKLSPMAAAVARYRNSLPQAQVQN